MLMVRLVLALSLLCIVGCAQWLPARSKEISLGVYELTATGNSFSSRKALLQKIDAKAKRLCGDLAAKRVGPSQLDVGRQETYINGVKQTGHYIVVKQVVTCESE